MAFSGHEITEGLRQAPQPPFFAVLNDPRRQLTAVQRKQHPELGEYWDEKAKCFRNRAFIVIKVQSDRDDEHPGVWFMPQGCEFWVDAEWVTIHEFFTIDHQIRQ